MPRNAWHQTLQSGFSSWILPTKAKIKRHKLYIYIYIYIYIGVILTLNLKRNESDDHLKQYAEERSWN